MKQIPLTQEQVELVDDADYEWLNEMGSWFAQWNQCTKSFYAVRNIGRSPNRKTLRMHRVIWEHHNGPIPNDITVDHKNRNTLDNRLSNLRLATYSQQRQNQGLPINSISGYRGVGWHKQRGKWSARIRVNGKSIWLGLFDDKDDAARAYDAAARIYHDPEFAQLNFPQEVAA